MSWEKLLADRAITPLPPTKQELDNLRSIVTRSDARFVMAYDAARTLSLMVVACFKCEHKHVVRKFAIS